MAIKVEESYHTLLGISLQSGGQRGESPRMEPNIVSTSQQYRVVTPYHTFRAYPFRQPPESTEPRFQCRQVTFHIPAVWIQRELEIEGVAVSAGSVLDRFLGKDAPVQRTLFEVFREHNDKCARLSGTDMAPATVQRYETSLKHTQDFVWETYHKKDILLDEVSRQFVEDYEFLA